MFQETPIYNRLVAERGDIPARVRGEADRIRRDLAQVMRSEPGAAAGLFGQSAFSAGEFLPSPRNPLA
ncbi:hypothetical protein ACIPSA_44505 [Streptomyces sp. NPDC086549]|uniref:hypothetical protein n=1 Tax=Streptomyces sp. NPDC086549 TaxID=3365752 RepID=UPI00380EADBD